jgi:hypothetical protein
MSNRNNRNKILDDLLNRMLETQLPPMKLPDPTLPMQRPDPDAWRKWEDSQYLTPRTIITTLGSEKWAEAMQKAKDRLAFLESLDEAGREVEILRLLKEN